MTSIWILYSRLYIRKQFKNLAGLQSTSALPVHPRPLITPAHPFLQMIHSKGNHWVVASTIASPTTVQVFDSLYSSIGDMTTKLLMNLFAYTNYQPNVVIGCCLRVLRRCTYMSLAPVYPLVSVLSAAATRQVAYLMSLDHVYPLLSA